MPREVRERQMLDAAVAAFARNGYQAASMDDIAEAAGVSKPLVYLYLKSKEELFMACVRREVGALVAAVREGTRERGAAADQQLWNGLTAFFAHTAARPDGVAVLHRARTQGEPFVREIAAMRAELAALVTSLLGQAARDAGCDSALAEREVSGLAQALVGAAESLAEWANILAKETPSSAPSAQETAATLMNLCWSGLQNRMKGERWLPTLGVH
ncbi:TetR/AcrR family transcriptional regulator [Streptomyces sp. NBC_01775]|uniref:TetR/AcrR family transcriptional regulator n=1 Tax=Streptomyces sp. NBC_01775 TaxID=2975939 RepID=UPI002DDACE3C|nr:TetR/AcrR family transcriptional regulator [Streptomyces sp. NBC_01775]WSB77476.1 TetR/AcrR family transcriptional regulator [Streptomyces sp. NBC_01775]